jgi:riboflavin transporter FmnP
MKSTERLKKCIATSILAAISLVLYLVGPKFSLPIFPSFLVINFSMLPIFIAILTMGPIEGLVIVLIRTLIKLPATNTAGIGETADLVIGFFLVGFTFLGNIIFGKKKHYIPLFLFSILGWVLGGLVSNAFALPMYVNVLNAKGWVVGSLHKIIPDVNERNYVMYYFLLAVLPFNLLLSSVVCIITYGVYLPLHKYTDQFFGKEISENKYIDSDKETITSNTYKDIE